MRHGVEARETQASLEKSQEPGNSVRPAGLVDEFAEDEFRPRGALCDGGEDAREEGVDEESDDVVADVDEELVPALRLVGGVHEADDADDELAPQEAAGGNQCDPAGDVDPARDPREDGNPLLPAYDGDPVVLTAGRGVGGEEFGERGGEREVADSGGDEAPDDGCGTAGGEGEVEGCGEGGPGV
ncbi:hypothetical protein V492_01496 [Pseudogymnoascus sp. VKM F-4246]|nr:hypothetical protein V492_01496 [Pseudogymnoascus sp. VKM F-4246]